jgi:hypothetical protein
MKLKQKVENKDQKGSSRLKSSVLDQIYFSTTTKKDSKPILIEREVSAINIS